ncbi:aspartate aminotransferase family protein [Mesorhizobium sp. DCY119]|uniref:aspartate aminotransferase family protein n=1 Tax=Mesorhizobium sp. DCY119 TaxID=2108445 RepID=UPI000E74F33B|nr:aspartate aminotransferase family protein [Mesorhizobium sp. DCY119]RJG41675.1 aspartate aminotransferase family protein [Mesorhizobium sp. DCY119]
MTIATKEILALNRFDASQTNDFSPELAERIARRSAAFGASSVLFYQQPIEMVRAKGAFMYDAQGQRYLDVYNNVPSVGHCHPRVVEAIARQAGTLNIHTRYLASVVEAYAERLLATFPGQLSNVVFTCTGSESNDLAMRIAQIGTGAKGFIVTETAYHGNTALVTEISPSSLRRRKPAPYVRVVPAPSADANVGERFAAAVKVAIAELQAEGFGVAALVADSIFSSDGIYADPPGFLKPAVDAVRQSGGLFIADEVQPGFGRTGGMWGFLRHGIEPDLVTMGKPMGNGFPMGGIVTRPELLAAFCEETGYFNTFGGNPVAAAAGLAVLDVIRDEELLDNAREVGDYFREGLKELSLAHASIGAVRGAGLFIGLDFIVPDERTPGTSLASHVINRMKENGILIGAAGKYGATLKIRPPLCFSRQDAGYFMATLADILKGG